MNKDNWLSLGTVRSRNTDEDNLLGRCTTSSNATGDHLSKDENDPTNFVPSSFYVRFWAYSYPTRKLYGRVYGW